MEDRKSRCGYHNGSSLTSVKLTDMLPLVMKKIHYTRKISPASLLEVWPDIIGPSFSPFTKAIRFDEETLHVCVKNASVMSLLAAHNSKKRIIECYCMRFPQTKIANIIFRIGKID